MTTTTPDSQTEIQNRALSTLVAAIRLAQSKGAFTMEESAAILEAIRTFERPAVDAQAAATTTA
jgi:hypothetical protein